MTTSLTAPRLSAFELMNLGASMRSITRAIGGRGASNTYGDASCEDGRLTKSCIGGQLLP